NGSETLWAYISQNVEKGFISPSSSSTGAPILFVKKNDGGLCLCVDYHKRNAVTRKNRYPFPPMNQLLPIFNGSNIFPKIALPGPYNLLRIKEGYECLTAFRTKYGSYEYLVMPSGFTNAPSSFQNLLNDILGDLLGIFAVVYFDDIMVFSSSQEKHVKHVASVLQRLRDNHLFDKASKNYSKKITALTSILKKDSPLIFNEEALSQFPILEEAFTTAPILLHFNPSLPTIVETDASDYALDAVVSQVNDSGKHPVAFDSHKLLPAELNYEIHDKELLCIVCALKHWRAFLLSLSDSFVVLTDHSSLQYFMQIGHFTSFLVTSGQWVPREGADFISKNPQKFHQALKQNEIKESRFFSIKVEVFSDLVDQIQKAVWQDKDHKENINQLATGESVSDYALQPQAKLLLFKDRVVIPSNHELQLDMLQKPLDSPLAGHPGQEKTLKLIKRDFYWARMNKIIKDYVSSCQPCSINKNIPHKNFGLLRPLQIPSCPWSSLSMDFITQFPLSRNFDSILVVVEIFSKMEIFIPTYSTITSLDLAPIFISHVFSKHCLPSSIVSDRGSLLVSSFWTQLCQKIKISRDILTSFHPETDGQTERVNQILEQYLWMY
ncbi:hypothetical protein O181_105013, partial [Austropuccinia psidii MF-1]|nr:hypothetical protein [Austropuccinia psidii MF-1]